MGGVEELVVVPIPVPVATHFNAFTLSLCEHARKSCRTGGGGLGNITQKRERKEQTRRSNSRIGLPWARLY